MCLTCKRIFNVINKDIISKYKVAYNPRHPLSHPFFYRVKHGLFQVFRGFGSFYHIHCFGICLRHCSSCIFPEVDYFRFQKFLKVLVVMLIFERRIILILIREASVMVIMIVPGIEDEYFDVQVVKSSGILHTAL